MPNQTENTQVTRELLAVFEHGRLEVIDELVDSDFVNHEAPPGSPQGPGGSSKRSAGSVAYGDPCARR
jgi:hypothetical protein